MESDLNLVEVAIGLVVIIIFWMIAKGVALIFRLMITVIIVGGLLWLFPPTRAILQGFLS